MVKEFTCSSGRKFKIKALNIDQRVEIDDDISEYYFKLGVDFSKPDEIARATIPLKVALKACRYAGIDNDDLTTLELVELLTEINNISHLSETQKKS